MSTIFKTSAKNPSVRAILCASLFVLTTLALLPCFGAGADTNTPAAVLKAENTNLDDTLRAYLQLQEQLHATQLEVERTRQESDAAAARYAEIFAARLQAIEQSLGSQRAKELEAMRSSNQVMLVVAGAFAVFGLLAMLLTALFQWRTIHRLAEISSILPAVRSLGAGPALALGPDDAPLLGARKVEQSNSRLLGAIDRLEQRIHELEDTAHQPQNSSASAAEKSNGAPETPAPEPAAAEPDRAAVLVAKGQSLLNLEKNEEAVGCFDEVLRIHPNHTEALVRKGTALERLRRLDEALQCYDQAIAADGSLTIAYLYKGGLFNRQDRFVEALECYEQALRTQEKPRHAA